MRRSLLLVALLAAACVQTPLLAQTRTRCVLHADSMSARVDSCSTTKPPAPAPAPPPPAPAPAPPPAPSPAPPPPSPSSTLCAGTFARTVSVSNATQLKAALVAAKPGDKIQMADGTYAGAGELRVRSTPGTAAQRIAVCGSSKAIIDAGSQTGTTGLSLVGASYWTFSGFTITDGLFGVYAESSDHLVLDHLTIHAIGQEAIALKKASHHSVVQYSTIYDTGRSIAEYGEGVYVGSTYSTWASASAPDKTDSVLIQFNTIGPNVRAEHIDVKEGTTGTRIHGNHFDGSGMVESQGTGESGWPNSPVILQGMNALADSNVATHPLVAGFRVVTHGTSMTGSGNVFAGNSVDVGGAAYGFLIQAGASSSTNTVACSNTAANATKGLANVACR